MRLGPVMVDLAGLEVTRADVERLRHPQVGALILFARNFESPLQLVRLVESMESAVRVIVPRTALAPDSGTLMVASAPTRVTAALAWGTFTCTRTLLMS